VTQLTRGEVAVVDLTAGGVVDVSHATPGINFLPVGAQPTDVAVAPDGVLAFVASAEVNKPAIYAIPGKRILGDSRSLSGAVPDLTSWPVCALPQKPGAMAIVPRASSADGGGPDGVGYEVVVVLPGEGKRGAKVLTIDPAPFLRGAGPDVAPAGLPPGATVPPGSLVDCPYTGAIDLSPDLPDTWTPGPTWDDGVPYDFPAVTPSAPDAGTDDGGADAGAPAPAGDAGAVPEPLSLPPAPGCATRTLPQGDAGAPGPALPVPSRSNEEPLGQYAAIDGNTLYVADGVMPLIHVIDLSVPHSPQRMAPLLAVSQANPQRRVEVGQIAVSPTTRDYKRYLYAIDRKEGSIMVFDVTDPATAPRVPLTRPHAEVNPFQPLDRISFGGPVASVAFARHDFSPRLAANGIKPLAGSRGLLCNPNGNAVDDPNNATRYDPGTLFREGAPNQDPQLPLGPYRLRGIFAFVTMATGQVVTIDVDDWDAPCRRPEKMDMATGFSAVAPAQSPPSSGDDLDPYRAPNQAVGESKEFFFPMSSPNHVRSRYLVRDDPDVGTVHVPSLTSRPQLDQQGTTLAVVGPDAPKNPLLVPARSTFPSPLGDPAVPGVRMAWEDPQVHIEQDWAVTFEGGLPRPNAVVGELTTADNYQTMTLSHPAGFFCRSGIEDLRVGTARAKEQLAELATMSSSLTPAMPMDRRTVDYVQVTDEILNSDEPYWRADNDCWDEHPNPADAGAVQREAERRFQFCGAAFGHFDGEPLPNVLRDFPVLEAYDDHLVLGRFGYTPRENAPLSTSNRVAVSADPTNVSFLRQLRCCFHNQVHFNIRAGGTWVTTGSAVGFMHHIRKDDVTGACVASCKTNEALLNGRAPAVASPGRDPALAPYRNSALAMRNPMFAFVVYNGVAGGLDVLPIRDMQWRFSTRGGFSPLAISIASQTVSVSPQSMRFVDSFQQMAVVDGAAQGLVLIDLNSIAFAHAPYF